MALKALIVDDDKFMRKIMENFLNKYNVGIENFQAQNGMEAIEILKEQAIDLVLLDLYMPVMDGKSVLKFIRNSNEFKDLTVVIVSTANPEDVYEVVRLGISGYFIKPVDPKIVDEKLRSIVYDLLLKKGLTNTEVKNVLVIDTDKEFKKTLQDLFGRFYPVYRHEDIDTALRICRTLKPEAIFINTETIIGWQELLEQIHATIPLLPPPGIVLLSEHTIQPMPNGVIGVYQTESSERNVLQRFICNILRDEANFNRRALAIIRDQLIYKMDQIMMQTIKVLTSSMGNYAYSKHADPPPEMQVFTRVTDLKNTISIAVSINGPRRDMKELGKLCLKDDQNLTAEDGLHKLIRTFTGEIVDQLGKFGIVVLQGDSVFSNLSEKPLTFEWAARFPYEDKTLKQIFVVTIGLEGGSIVSDYV
jgi:CheY-like chemotaxis protein